MDPVSTAGLAGATIAMADALCKTVRGTATLHGRWMNADGDLQYLMGNLATVKLVAQQASEWLMWESAARGSMLAEPQLREQVQDSFAQLHYIVVEMNEVIKRVGPTDKRGLSITAKLRLLMKNEQLQKLCKKLVEHQVALGFLFQLLRENSSLATRVRPQDRGIGDTSESTTEQSTSALMVRSRSGPSYMPTGEEISSLSVELENEILRTQVYRTFVRSSLRDSAVDNQNVYESESEERSIASVTSTSERRRRSRSHNRVLGTSDVSVRGIYQHSHGTQDSEGSLILSDAKSSLKRHFETSYLDWGSPSASVSSVTLPKHVEQARTLVKILVSQVLQIVQDLDLDIEGIMRNLSACADESQRRYRAPAWPTQKIRALWRDDNVQKAMENLFDLRRQHSSITELEESNATSGEYTDTGTESWGERRKLIHPRQTPARLTEWPISGGNVAPAVTNKSLHDDITPTSVLGSTRLTNAVGLETQNVPVGDLVWWEAVEDPRDLAHEGHLERMLDVNSWGDDGVQSGMINLDEYTPLGESLVTRFQRISSVLLNADRLWKFDYSGFTLGKVEG